MLFSIWGTVRAYTAIQFSIHCSGYLKLAADSSNVDMAHLNLNKAIDYIDANELNEGFTSVLWKSPTDDIGFWSKNLHTAYVELGELDTATLTPLEQSNVLMKLREVLLDQGDTGQIVTHPEGISIFPYNRLWFFWGWISGIGFVVFLIVFIILVSEY